ncbi:MAG: hypothetical protein Q9226_005363, partial [Calogaya cf. arnoldii]
MHLVKPFLILTSLTLSISSALPPLTPASPLLPLSTNPKSDVLCYTAHYASRRPAPHDCLTIIANRIAPTPNVAQRMRYFSRRPTSKMLGLPHTWESSRGLCGVTIDIPGGPDSDLKVAEASLFEIKEAAKEILEE